MPRRTARTPSVRPSARLYAALAATLAAPFAAPLEAQTADPFPDPLGGGVEALVVRVRDFATLPDVAGVPARMMLLLDEPATRRLFVSDMQGPLYTLGYDGRNVVEYLDLTDPRWGVRLQAQGRERGFQSFALHPEFAQRGAPGYGKLYTWLDTENTEPAPDFRPGGGNRTHDTVLLEWTAADATAGTYDGGPPREVLRIEQPFANHNAGRIAFHPFAPPGSPGFGLLFVNVADGGSAGDPLGNAQRRSSAFGKILRIDPLGRNAANGKYGIPEGNPFALDNDTTTLGEVYATGLRNPQHLAWDRSSGRMFVTDIGQSTIEELSVVTEGANLGWNAWEGSFRFAGPTGVDPENPRADARVTYPVAEYDQTDPLLGARAAVTGLAVYRSPEIPALAGAVLFGDLPSGEMFAIAADHLPSGGQAAMRRVLLDDGDGAPKPFLALVQARTRAQGKEPAARADLRFHPGNEGRVYLLNKADGTIRVLAP